MARPARWTTPARKLAGVTAMRCWMRGDFRLAHLDVSSALPFQRQDAKTLRSNGCRLSYYVEGQGPSVVLIHGTSVGEVPGVLSWMRWFRTFAVSWFDNRGYGQSLPIPAALSVEDMGAEIALALMDAESMDRAHLIGHSQGKRLRSVQLPKRQVACWSPVSAEHVCVRKNAAATGSTAAVEEPAIDDRNAVDASTCAAGG